MSTITDPVRASASEKSGVTIIANKIVYALSRRWLLTLTLLLSIYVGTPWLAPVFMKLGWAGAGQAIYAVYSTQCHQLPQRSYFLFGPKAMYSLEEIQSAWQKTDNPIILRQFVGNPQMGWKVAWSDRMVSMYTSILAGLLIFGWLGKRLKPLPLWAFALFVLPMAADGGTHLVSDVLSRGRVGLGFRDSNVWLAGLTNNVFPPTFYAGDALGSFNSWMRILTGLLFGLGLVWLIGPLIADAFSDAAREIEAKFRRANISL
ncbi:MAG: DUF2085 domain-containing protein [Chloroflexi bacterium]|nr:DUF2085 domain-containing protein [Chloroflexota bacterium]